RGKYPLVRDDDGPAHSPRPSPGLRPSSPGGRGQFWLALLHCGSPCDLAGRSFNVSLSLKNELPRFSKADGAFHEMERLGVGLLGLGTVGAGVARLLHDARERIAR